MLAVLPAQARAAESAAAPPAAPAADSPAAPPKAAPAARAVAAAPGIARFSTAPEGTPPAPWRVVTLPKIPRHTRYEIVALDGERVVRVQAQASYANLLHRLQPPAEGAPLLRWRWRLAQANPAADLRRKEGDDAAARLCVLFDVPLAHLKLGDRTLLRLGRVLFEPDLPAATICYVWDSRLPTGTWLPNAYTDRVRTLVVRSVAAGAPVGQWFDEQRDLRADFAAAFPHESDNGARALPPMVALGISGDADNTGASSLSYFGDVTLSAP